MLINVAARYLFRFAIVLGFVVSIAGCGGGGGGGGTSSGGSLSVSPTSLTFTASASMSGLPPPQPLTITFTGPVAQVFGGFPLGQQVSWLTMQQVGAGNTSPVQINVIPTALLSPGPHAAIVRVVTVDSSGNPLSLVDVGVTYNVTP